MVRGIVAPELFDRGGRLTDGVHLVENARGHDETILPQSPEQVFGHLDAAINAVREMSMAGTRSGGDTTVINATFRDERAFYEERRREARLGMTRYSSGRRRR